MDYSDLTTSNKANSPQITYLGTKIDNFTLSNTQEHPKHNTQRIIKARKKTSQFRPQSFHRRKSNSKKSQPIAEKQKKVSTKNLEDKVKKINFERESFKMIIQDVKQPQILDFGYQEFLDFEEINRKMTNQDKNQNQKFCQKWKILFDSIKRYPKFEKLQNYISQENQLKQEEKEKEKQKKLEEFLNNKRNEKKFEKKFAKAILSLEDKNVRFSGDIQQLMEEELKPRELTNVEVKLQELKRELEQFQKNNQKSIKEYQLVKKQIVKENLQLGIFTKRKNQKVESEKRKPKVDQKWSSEERKKIAERSISSKQRSKQNSAQRQPQQSIRLQNFAQNRRFSQDVCYYQYDKKQFISQNRINSDLISRGSQRTHRNSVQYQANQLPISIQSNLDLTKLSQHLLDYLSYNVRIIQTQLKQNLDKSNSNTTIQNLYHNLRIVTSSIENLKYKNLNILKSNMDLILNLIENQKLKSQIQKIINTLYKYFAFGQEQEYSYKTIVMKKLIRMHHEIFNFPLNDYNEYVSQSNCIYYRDVEELLQKPQNEQNDQENISKEHELRVSQDSIMKTPKINNKLFLKTSVNSLYSSSLPPSPNNQSQQMHSKNYYIQRKLEKIYLHQPKSIKNSPELRKPLKNLFIHRKSPQKCLNQTSKEVKHIGSLISASLNTSMPMDQQAELQISQIRAFTAKPDKNLSLS